MFKIEINNLNIFLFTNNIISRKVIIKLIRKLFSKIVHIKKPKNSIFR